MMSKYSGRNSEGLKFSIEADHIEIGGDRVIFYKEGVIPIGLPPGQITSVPHEFVALYLNPIYVVKEAE